MSFKFDNYSIPNPAFDRFGVGQFNGELFLFTSLRWLFSLPGLLLNPALLVISFRKNFLNIHGTCSLLLALGSACDLAFLLNFCVPFLLSIIGQNFFPLSLCFCIQFLPNLGLFSSVWIVFFVGLDRLSSVLFPFFYVRMEKSRLYLLIIFAVTFGYSLFVLEIAMESAFFHYPNRAVLCSNGDLFAFDGMSPMLLRNGLIINGAAFICYSLVWVALRRCQRKAGGDVHARKHRIFKSLAAIMVLVVGSYFLICILRLLYASVNSTFFQLHISPCISAVLTSTAATSNPVLLFAFSKDKDYRKAFRSQFQHWPLIGQLIGHNSAANSLVIPVAVTRTLGDIQMATHLTSRISAIPPICQLPSQQQQQQHQQQQCQLHPHWNSPPHQI